MATKRHTESATKHSPCSFEVALKCLSNKHTSHKTVILERYPTSVLDIKMQIEKAFDIPAFTQSIQYTSIVLSDIDNPRLLHVRSGDTLQVTFKATAECSAVKKTLTWLSLLVNMFRSQLPSSSDILPRERESAIWQPRIADELRNRVFIPWDSDTKQMNKEYFLHMGGLDLVIELHSLLLKQKWNSCPLYLKYIEMTLLTAMYHLASTYKLRRVLINHGCISPCMQSLLRVQLKRKSKVEVLDKTGAPCGAMEVFVVKDVMGTAMGTLCNMCEVTEAHTQIASNLEVLEQFICIALSPSYDCWWAQLVASAFVCFAHTVEIHQFLTSPDVMNGLLDACQLLSAKSSPYDSLLLNYFIQLFLAQLILVSPTLLPPILYQRIKDHMVHFFSNATLDLVSSQERKCGFFWSIATPYLKLVYVPLTRHQDEVLCSLQSLSLKTALLTLECMLANADSRQCLLEEELTNYIICIPWHVSSVHHDKAKQIVAILGQYSQLQPPKLSVLAKAKLAKMHFGLERVLQAHSLHDLFRQ